MQLLKIEQVWFNWSATAIFLTIAIIATLFLILLLVYSLFSDEIESEQSHARWSFIRLEARTLLSFFTAFGWTATIASYYPNSFAQMIGYGSLVGIAVAVLVGWLGRVTQKQMNENTETNTGRVLKSIPPHRGGIGKVYLNVSRTPIEVDAITIGRELPVGVPVRVVDMLDDHTALVEPIDNQPREYK